MPQLWGFVIVVGSLAAVMTAFMLLAARIRRRGAGGAIMGPIDEIYNPAAHRLRFEIETHEHRMLPTPSTPGLMPERQSGQEPDSSSPHHS